MLMFCCVVVLREERIKRALITEIRGCQQSPNWGVAYVHIKL
jgi:hypothetical protein